MDDIKDIQKVDQVSAFLDNQRERTSPFGQNRSGERLYRRGERLVVALYLLTNHIAKDEPLKSQLRNSATEMLANILAIRDEMRSADSSKVRTFQASIRYLISLVRMLTVSGYVSHQNANVVCEALDELGNFLQSSQRSNLSENIRISPDDLSDVPFEDKRKVTDRREIKDSAVSSIKHAASDKIFDVRKQNILNTLTARGELGIREICANLPEYSEKMVQRELAELVAMGRVRKSGLKRWSKYALLT
jgi:hypothetical protein